MAIWQNGSCLGLQTRISLFDSGYRLQICACVVFNGNMFGFHPKVEGSNPFIRSSFGCDRILELSLEVPIGNRLRGWPIQALTKCFMRIWYSGRAVACQATEASSNLAIRSKLFICGIGLVVGP